MRVPSIKMAIMKFLSHKSLLIKAEHLHFIHSLFDLKSAEMVYRSKTRKIVPLAKISYLDFLSKQDSSMDLLMEHYNMSLKFLKCQTLKIFNCDVTAQPLAFCSRGC